MRGGRKLIAVGVISALSLLILWQQSRLSQRNACLRDGGTWTGTACAPGRGPILERDGLKRA
jgi:hypothetical protein